MPDRGDNAPPGTLVLADGRTQEDAMWSPLRRRTPRRLVVALALVTLAASACSSGGEQATGADDAAPAAATLELEAGDFAFAPATLAARPGSEVTVRVRNTGQAPHTFTVAALGVDVAVKAGESSDVRFTMPAQGPVEFVCTYHLAQGMKGTISPA